MGYASILVAKETAVVSMMIAIQNGEETLNVNEKIMITACTEI